MSQDFLGIGWKYPLRLTKEGDVALSSAEEDIEEAIWIILGTVPGERLMHPDFGCRIHELVFASNNTNTIGLARHYVEDAIRHWEPRIDEVEVEVQTDPIQRSLLLINVSYRIRAADSRNNLVYPFYLTRGGSE